MGISIVRFNQSGQRTQWGIVEQKDVAILLNFTNDEKRRTQLLKTQKSVRYLQPGDTLTLSLKSRDGALDFGAHKNGVRDEAS